MKTLDYAFYFAVGAAGGAVVTISGWAVFSYLLSRQFQAASADFVQQGGVELRRTLDVEIPARVRQEMDRKLAEVGITRTTGAQLRALLEGADRIGLIGLRGLREGCVPMPPRIPRSLTGWVPFMGRR